jgi:predicted MFS family arabinose efflux permease
VESTSEKTSEASSYRWVVLALAYIAFFSQFAIYLSWNPFIPMASDIFGLSMQQAGNIAAATAMGRTLFQIPGGIIVDRYNNPKYVLSGCLVLLGLCTWLAGLNGTYFALLFSQFCIGASGVVVWPLCVKLVVEWFPERERDSIGGILNSGTTVAVAVINVFVPYAVNAFGWSSTFYSLGILAVLTATAVIIVMKPIAAQNRGGAPAKRRFSFSDVNCLLKNKKFLQGLAVYVGATYTTWGISTWLVTYLIRQANMPVSTASSMMMLFGICGAVSMPFVGALTKGNPLKRYIVISFSLGLLTLMLVGLPWIKSGVLLWGYVLLMGFAAFSYMGPLNLMVTDIVARNQVATAMAIMIVVWQICSMLQSLLIGCLLDNIAGAIRYHMVFWIIAMGSFTACMASISLKRGG